MAETMGGSGRVRAEVEAVRAEVLVGGEAVWALFGEMEVVAWAWRWSRGCGRGGGGVGMGMQVEAYDK